MENETTMSVFQDAHAEIEIDLWDMVYFIFRKLHYIILAGVIGALLSALYISLFATPMYEATAQIYVVNSKDAALELTDLQIATYQTADYSLVFDTWEVNQQVKDELSLPYSIAELRQMVTVTNPSDTRALFITVRSADPHEAMEMANTYSDVGKQYIYDTMVFDMPRTLSVALEPSSPVSPQPLRTTALCALLGMFLSVVLLAVAYLKNDRITTPDELEKFTKVALLGVIPYSNSPKNHRNRKGRS